jgi:hypothetical protein
LLSATRRRKVEEVMKKLLRFSLWCCIALISSALPTPAQIQNGVPFRDASAASASAPAGAHLSYFGGPVVAKPHIVQVLYGAGSYNAHVAGTLVPTMGNFFADLLGTNSGYINLLGQYNTIFSGGTNQGIGNGTFDGLFTINPSAGNNGSTIDDSNIQAELLAQINAGQLPAPIIGGQGNVNTIYMIYFPPGKTITAGGQSSCVVGGFCAYHSTTSNTLNSKHLLYGVIPDLKLGSACSGGCGTSSVFGNYTTVTSHELSEAITDADVGIATTFAAPLAWYDPNNGEIGDICNLQQGSYTANGTTYTMQLEFSNAANNCVLPPPVLTASYVCGRGTNGIDCALSNGTSFGPAFPATTNFSDAQGWSSNAVYYGSVRLADVNGDGKADVCGRQAAGIQCALGNGDGTFGGLQQWDTSFSDAGGWNQAPYGTTIMFADLNGDGKADVCGRGTNGIDCALSNGTSFGPAFPATTNFSDAQGWSSNAVYYGSLRLADVNGDGKADVCGRQAAGIQCALGNGDGTFGGLQQWDTSFSDANGWNQAPYGTTIMFADLNGDGRADVCGRGGDGIYCALSNGTSFGPAFRASTNFSDAQGWGGSVIYYGSLRLADVNGDGKADVCGRQAAGMQCALGNGDGTFGSLQQWDTFFSDADGWNQAPYGPTIMLGRPH